LVPPRYFQRPPEAGNLLWGYIADKLGRAEQFTLDGASSALTLCLREAFSTKAGQPVPWTVLRRAIDDSIKARWIELAANSCPWPCEIAAASTVTLKQPTASGGMAEPVPGGYLSKPKGVCTSSAALQPAALQDLVDVLPDAVTDLLMASLVVLEPFGVRVDLPDEPTTGGDMEWIYAALLEINGGRYLRLILQAKRAQNAKRKTSDYWFYKHLDHDAGQQAQTLMQYAATSPDGMPTLPLYIFYHPASALAPASGPSPAVEGVNIVFASAVAPIVMGGCSRGQKKVNYWRREFLPLSDLLCWPVVVGPPTPPPADATQFMVGSATVYLPLITGAFHPDLVARRFQNRRDQARRRAAPGTEGLELPPIVPVDGIPDDIRRAIDGNVLGEVRKRLERPRVIFTTRMTREDPAFSNAAEATRRR
jgi:hypothetical protein